MSTGADYTSAIIGGYTPIGASLFKGKTFPDGVTMGLGTLNVLGLGAAINYFTGNSIYDTTYYLLVAAGEIGLGAFAGSSAPASDVPGSQGTDARQPRSSSSVDTGRAAQQSYQNAIDHNAKSESQASQTATTGKFDTLYKTSPTQNSPKDLVPIKEKKKMVAVSDPKINKPDLENRIKACNSYKAQVANLQYTNPNSPLYYQARQNLAALGC